MVGLARARAHCAASLAREPLKRCKIARTRGRPRRGVRPRCCPPATKRAPGQNAQANANTQGDICPPRPHPIQSRPGPRGRGLLDATGHNDRHVPRVLLLQAAVHLRLRRRPVAYPPQESPGEGQRAKHRGPEEVRQVALRHELHEKRAYAPWEEAVRCHRDDVLPVLLEDLLHAVVGGVETVLEGLVMAVRALCVCTVATTTGRRSRQTDCKMEIQRSRSGEEFSHPETHDPQEVAALGMQTNRNCRQRTLTRTDKEHHWGVEHVTMGLRLQRLHGDPTPRSCS